jgi:hypothetical protein
MKTSSTIRFAAMISLLVCGAGMLGAQTPPANPATPAPVPSPVPAVPAPEPPKPSTPAGVVKVGTELKRNIGRVIGVEPADNGCYFTLKDAKGNEFIEIGKMELCDVKPSYKGKQVELDYRVETIQAGSCYGDPKCRKIETVPIIVQVKVLD